MGTDFDIVCAALISRLNKSRGEVADKKLLDLLLDKDHGVPFEHTALSFNLRMPGVVERHIVKYRHASLSAQSRRYTEVQGDDFYEDILWPDEDGEPLDQEIQDAQNKRYLEHLKADMKFYQGSLALGIAKDHARLTLANLLVYSDYILTLNVASMMNVLKQRLPSDAQEQTREYARAFGKIFEAKFPLTATAFKDWAGVSWD
jgi:flavin-dependent thymidylate synthase